LLWLAVLVTVTALVEWQVLSPITFRLLAVSAEWPIVLHLFVLMLPRFLLMMLITIFASPFPGTLWVVAFIGTYVLVLLALFFRVETYVNWGNPVAVMRATLPYIAGFCGAALGVWLRRRPLALSSSRD
jgi:hypothetical protein